MIKQVNGLKSFLVRYKWLVTLLVVVGVIIINLPLINEEKEYKKIAYHGAYYGMIESYKFHKYLLSLETIESDDDSVKEKRFNVKIFKKYSNSLDKTKAQINYLDYKDFGTDTNFRAHALINIAIDSYLKAQGYGYSIGYLLTLNMWDEKGYYINIPIEIHNYAISESLLTVKAYIKLWRSLKKHKYDELDDEEYKLKDKTDLFSLEKRTNIK